VFKEINLYRKGMLTQYGVELMEPENLEAVWSYCKKQSNMEHRVASAKQFNQTNRYKKRGVAMMPVKIGMGMRSGKGICVSSALVHLYTDGTAMVAHGGIEMGQGLHTKIAQIAAEALGIPIENVHSTSTDTQLVANAAATGGSIGSGMMHSLLSLSLSSSLSSSLSRSRCPWPIGPKGLPTNP
jgi:xanthine dehydrogenase/oxidase